MTALQRIRDSRKFRDLVAKRNRIAIILSILVLIAYYGYILLIAFDKEFLATKMGTGMTTSIGIPMGAGVIIFTIILTAWYVRKANTEFDAANAEILREAQQ